MVQGPIRQRRREMVEQTSLIWGANEIDLRQYLISGNLEQTNVGGDIEFDDDMQKIIDEKIAAIRAKGGGLPISGPGMG